MISVVSVLQVEQYAHLEEHLISVVTELARHSPSSSNAIVKCPKLVASVVNRLARKDSMYIHPVMIKALGLLKVIMLFILLVPFSVIAFTIL